MSQFSSVYIIILSQGLCCLSVVTDFITLKQYNLQSISGHKSNGPTACSSGTVDIESQVKLQVEQQEI